MVPTEDLQLEHFAPLVGETFAASFEDDGSLDLLLTEAAERPTGNEKDVAFSLLFRGPLDPVFQQSLVHITQDAIGTHVLFLVAIGEGENGRTYEAVFTRLVG